MTHYYITDNTQPKGFIELTEIEWLALIGDETTHPYATKVYRGKIAINDVPEDLQEVVQAIVNAKIARWGEYKDQKITSNELQTMIEEVL